jgi:hypothetical protein
VRELPDYAKGLTVLAASVDPRLVGYCTDELQRRSQCPSLSLFWILTDLVKLGLIMRHRESVPSRYMITTAGQRLLKAEFNRVGALMKVHDG